jgi:dTDP-4-dehydrorhamnose 3,5-epimerase
MEIIPGVCLTDRKTISNPKGNIYHILKATDEEYCGFGEAYMTTVHHNVMKGWKKHKKMVLNLVVLVGEVCFYFVNEKENKNGKVVMSDRQNRLLTVSPEIWMAFEGKSNDQNLVLNIASIAHDPDEAINAPSNTFPLI